MKAGSVKSFNFKTSGKMSPGAPRSSFEKGPQVFAVQ
jgi:hypothetical protein